MTFLKNSFFLGIVLGLGACVNLLPDPGTPPQRLFLDPPLEISLPSTPSGMTVAVALPSAPLSLDSVRILLKKPQGILERGDYIANVEWMERLPLMVQRHLIYTLEASKRFIAVGAQTDLFKHTFLLETDIRHFNIVLASPTPYAEVVFSLKLLQLPAREVAWQKTLQAKAPIMDHSLRGFIQGLTQAYTKVLKDVPTAF